MRQIEHKVFDYVVAVMAAVIVILISAFSYQSRKIDAYELAFKTIASDMQINYGLHQGAMEQLKECK